MQRYNCSLLISLKHPPRNYSRASLPSRLSLPSPITPCPAQNPVLHTLLEMSTQHLLALFQLLCVRACVRAAVVFHIKLYSPFACKIYVPSRCGTLSLCLAFARIISPDTELERGPSNLWHWLTTSRGMTKLTHGRDGARKRGRPSGRATYKNAGRGGAAFPTHGASFT